MPKDTSIANKIALLATGDEIIHGDILNTNSQCIAQTLFANRMTPGLHLSVSDRLEDIETAILFLLKNHRALIITGGLGPTSDDLTRYALSNALKRPLVFDESAWQAICARLVALGYKEAPPEGNRQQALFPEKANLIANPNGTAAGCFLTHHNQLIFMLPGPPNECLPMMAHTVVPTLIHHEFQEVLHYERWLLFGASEGEIAEKLDAITKPFSCRTGYRLCYPYIEFKMISLHKKDIDAVRPLIEAFLKPYLIQDGKIPASQLLQKKLLSHPYPLFITDEATGGLLEATLKTPENAAYLHFNSHESPKEAFKITIQGLKGFWENQSQAKKTNLTLVFQKEKITTSLQTEAPLRGERTKLYAVEWICKALIETIFPTTNAPN